MNALFSELACSVVRWWTRLYTAGLPALTREIRLDEIESDLWESAHDPTRAPMDPRRMLGRLLRGMPDDLRWRAARTPPRSIAALAASIVGAGILVTWFYVNFLGPQTLPRPHGAPMNFVSDRPRLPPPPPPR